MPVILTLEMQKQKNKDFEASLGYIRRFCVKKKIHCIIICMINLIVTEYKLKHYGKLERKLKTLLQGGEFGVLFYCLFWCDGFEEKTLSGVF
jgi:hypothetical protein